LCAAVVTPAAGQEILEVEGTARHPLEPPDTTSPRATLQSFLADANAAWRSYLRLGEEARGEGGAARRHVLRAARCFDLSEVPPAQWEETAAQTVIRMLDVFNRIPLPAPRDVPDAGAMKREGQARWVLPHTNIAIMRIDEGPRAGEWLFTAQVVERAKEFYQRTRQLPLKPGAVVEDGFEIYGALTGWMIPVAWIESLPEWAQEVYLEQTVWQWSLLIALLGLVALLAWTTLRWSRRIPTRGWPVFWPRLVAPACLMLLSWGALYMIDNQFGITGTTFGVLQTLFSSVLYLAAAWSVMVLGSVVADAMLSSPAIEPQGIDTQLVRMGARIASFLVAVVVVAEGARAQGIPVVGLIAGLGIGGLAVALAAQSSIENFIGSLTLFADRPVRVGDFCRFGDKLGTVEQIGLRSTRIRTLDRSILSVPNAEFSRLQIDNLTRRDRILFQTTLNLRLETSSEQLQQVLTRVRELLLRHGAVDPEPARIRLVSVGPQSLALEIFAYVKTTNWDEFLAIREQLFLQLLQEVEQAGTALAPPAHTAYLRSADPPAPHAGEPAAG
jgi:MscS family membrane protein